MHRYISQVYSRSQDQSALRDKVVNALSDLIRALEEGSPPQEKIDKAKDAIEVWMNQLLD